MDQAEAFFASLEGGAEVSSSNIDNNLGIKNENSLPDQTQQAESEPKMSIEERIVNILVPQMSVHEVEALITRIKLAGRSERDEFQVQSSGEVGIKAAPRFICDLCGNTEQYDFITDYARGDTICMGKNGSGCGNVVQDHIVNEGSAYRKFEGEEDKSHHGPAPNTLFSSGHNLRTIISDPTNSSSSSRAGDLRRAAEFVEMNLSQMGKDERRTRIGYKDQMKKKACNMIDHVAANLDLHEIVSVRSKEMFAEFRDLKEHVNQFEAVVAGCILSAFIDTAKDVELAQKALNRQKNQDLFPFKCPTCSIKFNAKRAMQFHRCGAIQGDGNFSMQDAKDLADEKSSEKLKELKYSASREIEVKIKNKKQWFCCPYCDKMYQRKSAVEEHLERHKNQSKKRKAHIDSSDIDLTRRGKTNVLESTNPSVQVNNNDKVLFRGVGRRPWVQELQRN